MTAIDTILATGISYRQLDYWVRRNWLKPGNAQAGSGMARLWPESELSVALLMGRMVVAGIPADVAHQVARAGGRADLAPGVRVSVAAVAARETGTGWPA